MIARKPTYDLIVSSSGNDATASRRRGKFLTLAAAESAAKQGDSVYVQPAAYSNDVFTKSYLMWVMPAGVIVNCNNIYTESDPANQSITGKIKGKSRIVSVYQLIQSLSDTNFCDLDVNCASMKIGSIYGYGGIGYAAPNSKIRYTFTDTLEITSNNYSVRDLEVHLTGISPVTSKVYCTTTLVGIWVGQNLTVSNARFFTFDFSHVTLAEFMLTALPGLLNVNNCDIWGTNVGGIGVYLDSTLNINNTIIRAIYAEPSIYISTAYDPAPEVYINFTGTVRMSSEIEGIATAITGTYTIDNKLYIFIYTFDGTTLTVNNHFYDTADSVYLYSTVTLPTGIASDTTVYYVRVLSSSTVSLHPTATDATNNTNAISLSGGEGPHYIMGT